MFEFFVILKGRHPNFLEQNNTKLKQPANAKNKIIDPP